MSDDINLCFYKKVTRKYVGKLTASEIKPNATIFSNVKYISWEMLYTSAWNTNTESSFPVHVNNVIDLLGHIAIKVVA